MAFIDASATEISFVEEVAPGVTPPSPPFQRVRFTEEGIAVEQHCVSSNEVRPDVEVSDLISTGESARGDLSFELSAGPEFDSLFEHALRGSFAAGELRAGADRKSMTVEKRLKMGAASRFFRYSGCCVDKLSLTLQAGRVMTGTVSFLGHDEMLDTGIIAGACYSKVNGNQIMAAPNVGMISMSAVAGALSYTNLSLRLKNNLCVQPAIGYTGGIGIGYGRREITGKISAFLQDCDLYEEAARGYASSLTFPISDGVNSYTFTLPRVRFTSRRARASNDYQGIVADLSFHALYDPRARTSFKILKNL